jgi:hypothetical protein
MVWLVALLGISEPIGEEFRHASHMITSASRRCHSARQPGRVVRIRGSTEYLCISVTIVFPLVFFEKKHTTIHHLHI